MLVTRYSNAFGAVMVLAWSCSIACPIVLAQTGPSSSAPTVDTILEKLRASADTLKTYQCRIEYLFEQPMLETKTVQKGMVYYDKSSENSLFRMNFSSKQEDDQKARTYREDYLFDGVWLTYVDYQEPVYQRRQICATDKPVDAFELASGNMPIVGFSANEDLKNEFAIRIADDSPAQSTGEIKLDLVVLPNSELRKNYQSLSFWISTEQWLPTRVDTLTTEDDIVQIKFIKAKVNTPINSKVFKIEVPKGFVKPEIVPLRSVKK